MDKLDVYEKEEWLFLQEPKDVEGRPKWDPVAQDPLRQGCDVEYRQETLHYPCWRKIH